MVQKGGGQRSGFLKIEVILLWISSSKQLLPILSKLERFPPSVRHKHKDDRDQFIDLKGKDPKLIIIYLNLL